MVDWSALTRNGQRSEFFRNRSDYKKLKGFLDSYEGSLPVSGLCIGVGNLEEPLSILATAMQSGLERDPNVSLGNTVDLHLVDIKKAREISARYAFGKISKGLSNCFLPEGMENKRPKRPIQPELLGLLPRAFVIRDGEYCFAPEIIEEVEGSVARGQFSTSVQDFLKKPGPEYDFIFCNNVLQYIDKEERAPIVNRLTTDHLKKGGISFLHFPRSIADSKSNLGAAALIEGDTRFFHLESMGSAAYRKTG